MKSLRFKIKIHSISKTPINHIYMNIMCISFKLLEMEGNLHMNCLMLRKLVHLSVSLVFDPLFLFPFYSRSLLLRSVFRLGSAQHHRLEGKVLLLPRLASSRGVLSFEEKHKNQLPRLKCKRTLVRLPAGRSVCSNSLLLNASWNLRFRYLSFRVI